MKSEKVISTTRCKCLVNLNEKLYSAGDDHDSRQSMIARNTGFRSSPVTISWCIRVKWKLLILQMSISTSEIDLTKKLRHESSNWIRKSYYHPDRIMRIDHNLWRVVYAYLLEDGVNEGHCRLKASGIMQVTSRNSRWRKSLTSRSKLNIIIT